MALSVHAIAIGSFVPMLRNLGQLLAAGEAHARQQGSDPDALLQVRLAPDMFPLVTQVQLACDHAREGTAHLAGQAPLLLPYDEQTISALQQRIGRSVDYLEQVTEAQLAGAEQRDLHIPLRNDKLELALSGLAFLRDWALPNFYFHVTTAYDILRQQGVPIGKGQFLGHMGHAIQPRTPG